jgi:hypothetical protein
MMGREGRKERRKEGRKEGGGTCLNFENLRLFFS